MLFQELKMNEDVLNTSLRKFLKIGWRHIAAAKLKRPCGLQSLTDGSRATKPCRHRWSSPSAKSALITRSTARSNWRSGPHGQSRPAPFCSRKGRDICPAHLGVPPSTERAVEDILDAFNINRTIGTKIILGAVVGHTRDVWAALIARQAARRLLFCFSDRTPALPRHKLANI